MRKTRTIQQTNEADLSPGGYVSADERRAAGKALREVTPRVAHGGSKPPRTDATRSNISTIPTKDECRS
jgi:hypothetical protein